MTADDLAPCVARPPAAMIMDDKRVLVLKKKPQKINYLFISVLIKDEKNAIYLCFLK